MGNGQYLLTRRELAELRKRNDRDGDDQLSYAEVALLAEEIRIREKSSTPVPDDVLRELFEKLDRDGSGYISFNEFHSAYELLTEERNKRKFPNRFVATLKKTGRTTELGLDVTLRGDVILVDRVTSGVVAEWNRLHPQKALQAGDAIVSVNGLSGDSSSMMEVIRTQITLKVTVARGGVGQAEEKSRRPAVRAADFRVVVRKGPGNTNLGIDYKMRGETIEVTRITGGLIGTWNRANPKHDVLQGDLIVAVNGMAGDAQAMLEVIRTQPVLDLSLVSYQGRRLATPPRPERFRARMARPESAGGLGILVAAEDSGPFVEIEEVRGGLFAAWNRTNPKKAFRPGDRIVGVNGISGDRKAIKRALQDSKELDIVTERPSDQEPMIVKQTTTGPMSPAGALNNPGTTLHPPSWHDPADGEYQGVMFGEQVSLPINTKMQYARQHRLRRLLIAWQRVADFLQDFRIKQSQVPTPALPIDTEWARRVKAPLKTRRRGRDRDESDDELAGDAHVAQLMGADSDGSMESITEGTGRRHHVEKRIEDKVGLRQPKPMVWDVEEWERHLSTAGVLAPRGYAMRSAAVPKVTLADIRTERRRLQKSLERGAREKHDIGDEESGVLGNFITKAPAQQIIHAIRDTMLKIPELQPIPPVRTTDGAELLEARRVLEALRATRPPPQPQAPSIGAPLPADFLVALGGPMAALLPSRGPLVNWPLGSMAHQPETPHARTTPFVSDGRSWV